MNPVQAVSAAGVFSLGASPFFSLTLAVPWAGPHSPHTRCGARTGLSSISTHGLVNNMQEGKMDMETEGETCRLDTGQPDADIRREVVFQIWIYAF